MCIAQAIRITPARIRCSVPAMIEAVLGFGCSVEVDDHFQASLSCPIDRSIEIRSCALCVWTPRCHITPVPDRNSYEVEASVFDLPKVVERDEVVPVGFEDVGTSLLSDLLAERPFVNNRVVGCAVALEDGRRDEAVSLE
jgi:hypothetical protein